jgi:predicted metal-dependent enzyme (double-stranded beta helix superfamily)
MADLDELVARCAEALTDDDPRLAVRDVLRSRVGGLRHLPKLMGDGAAGIHTLHRSPELTVLNVVWPPKISLFPHDHRMWAAIAIYRGQEDNAFYRRADGRLVPAGGKVLRDGVVLLLGDDAVHGVSNPALAYTGAIHVYGGDFFDTPRSQWDPGTLAEQPYSVEAAMAAFAEAEEAYRAEAAVADRG